MVWVGTHRTTAARRRGNRDRKRSHNRDLPKPVGVSILANTHSGRQNHNRGLTSTPPPPPPLRAGPPT